MTQETPKVKLFQRPIFQKIINPLFRGTIKTFCPPAATVIEIFKNFKTPADKPKPHNWTSIAIQVLCWGIILYAFGTKIITIDDALNLLQGSNSVIPNEPIVTVIDTTSVLIDTLQK